MKKLLILPLLLTLSACSIAKTEFTDADGTHFSTTMLLAPFSKLEGKDGQMRYTWTPENGNVAVGESTKGLDQTGQVDALNKALEALGKAIDKLAPAAAAVAP